MRSAPAPEKQQQRDKIGSDVAAFLARGGKVKTIAADVIDKRSHNEKVKDFKTANNGFVSGTALDPK